MSATIDLQRRMLFILHRGLVESRLLAQAGKHEQVYDLADALEPIPGWLAAGTSEYVDAVRENLESFLGALASWVEDMDGYYQNQGREVPPTPTWKMFGEMLAAARVYE